MFYAQFVSVEEFLIYSADGVRPSAFCLILGVWSSFCKGIHSVRIGRSYGPDGIWQKLRCKTL